MDNCYSVDHIAEDHILLGITLRNHNRSTALERSVIDYWWGLNMFYWIQTSPSASVIVQSIQTLTTN